MVNTENTTIDLEVEEGRNFLQDSQRVIDLMKDTKGIDTEELSESSKKIPSSKVVLEALRNMGGGSGGAETKGADGVSPTIETTPTEDGYTLTITDVNGTNSVEIKNGKDGKDGSSGAGGTSGGDSEQPLTGLYFTDTETSKIKKIAVVNGKVIAEDTTTETEQPTITTDKVVDYISGKTLKYVDADHRTPSDITVADSSYVYGITDFIDVANATSIVMSAFSRTTEHNVNYVLYNANKSPIYAGTCATDSVTVNTTNKFIKNYDIQLRDDAKYIRVVFWKNDAITWEHPFIRVTKSVGGNTSGEIQTIHFTQKINKYVANNTGNTLNKQDGETAYTDTGVLFLPSDYKEDGEKTRLVIACHGSGTVINNSFDMTTKKYVEALVKSGFAVLDVNGGVDDGRHYGAPFAIQSYVKAYHWAIDHYNIYKEVFVFGASMGGLSSFNLAQSGSIPVIAQAAFCPVVDLFRQAWMHPWYSEQGDYGVQRERIADYFGFADCKTYNSGTAQEATTTDMQYFIDNAENVAGYNPITTKTINADVILTTELTDYSELYESLIKLRDVPLKIWHAADDTTVKMEFGKYLVEAVKRGGGIAYHRQLPSGGHTPDLGGTVTMTDLKGDKYSNYAACYELVEWFNRWN